MNKIIERDKECLTLKKLKKSQKAEFLAVYGRRRVGKTFLVDRYFCHEPYYFVFTGQRNTPLKRQIKNFINKLNQYFPKFKTKPYQSWIDVFFALRCAIERLPQKKSKKILFFDELPWFCSNNSKFKEALEYFWNDWASKQEKFILIICGSAASWMLENIIKDKGGLHNRVTETIHLIPFSLSQTKRFLQSRNIDLENKQYLDLYMVMGGIPFYLNKIEKGISSAQTIDQFCFQKDGFLYNEFPNLFASLFNRPENYIAIIELLAKKRIGLTRNEILKGLNIKSGGTLTKTLHSLEECGFIGAYIPFGKKDKDCLYRLIDEYSLFYLVWIKPNIKQIASFVTQNYWAQIQNSIKWKTWSGYSFESICIKHVSKIIKALGISGILTRVMPWYYRPNNQRQSIKQKGAQIDMLIDRNDKTVNICEMKYSDTPFSITEKYYKELEQKIQIFKEQSHIKKTVFLTFISTYGCKENKYFSTIAHHNITMDCLFAD